MTRIHRIILLIVLAYEGLGGITGGILLSLEPDGRLMKMPVEIMHGTFSSFFIPGLLLLGLGFLNLFAFVKVIRRELNDWFWMCMALGGYTIWFIVEIIILQELHWLHLMWGTPVLLGIIVAIPLIEIRKPLIQKKLLLFGLFSSVWYFFINAYVPMQYEGYNVVSFTVSELSAIDAPTRLLWVLLCIFYPLLFAAFGWGLIKASNGNRRLLITGRLIIIYCLFNLYWPPMHMRGNTPTLTDTLHIVWASVTVLFMLIMMFTASKIFDKKFRNLTLISVVVLTVFGILTGNESPNIPVNGPTPFIGLWERINIGIFMAWIGVFSVKMYRQKHT